MIATHIAAATGGIGVFVGIALLIRYPLLKLALVAVAGLVSAFVLTQIRATLP